MQIGDLLDAAKAHTGSDANTARALHVSPQRLSDYRTGREKCPWKKQLDLCRLAKLGAGETVRHMEELAGNVGASVVAGALVTLSFGCFTPAQPAGSHGATSHAASMYRRLPGRA